jgi:ribosomal protein S18 acetylase RimI-like enzyme
VAFDNLEQPRSKFHEPGVLAGFVDRRKRDLYRRLSFSPLGGHQSEHCDHDQRFCHGFILRVLRRERGSISVAPGRLALPGDAKMREQPRARQLRRISATPRRHEGHEEGIDSPRSDHRHMIIRPAILSDFEGMWPIFQAVVATGTTYAFAPDTSREEAEAYWLGPDIASWVADEEGRIVGMYKLVPNRRDLGSHVANASFMVAPSHAGLGVGKALALHCLREARRAGFLAMQFNFVVSTNTGAIALWKKLGFEIVGTLPKAFRHSELGLVDAYVMYRFLDDIDPVASNQPRGSAP